MPQQIEVGTRCIYRTSERLLSNEPQDRKLPATGIMGDNAFNYWNHRNQQRSFLCFWHPLFACIFPTSTSLVDLGLPLLSMIEDHVLLHQICFLFFIHRICRPASSKIIHAYIGWLQQATKMNKIEEKLHLRTLCISSVPPVNVLSPINAPSVRLKGRVS